MFCRSLFVFSGVRVDRKSPGISLQDFKHLQLIFSQNLEESCTFQKIYGLGKVKLKPGRLEKNTNLVENVKEINYRFHTYILNRDKWQRH